jgi:hypothetical protein
MSTGHRTSFALPDGGALLDAVEPIVEWHDFAFLSGVLVLHSPILLLGIFRRQRRSMYGSDVKGLMLLPSRIELTKGKAILSRRLPFDRQELWLELLFMLLDVQTQYGALFTCVTVTMKCSCSRTLTPVKPEDSWPGFQW